MDRNAGYKSFPIWLIGDSNPKRWEGDLRSPLDSKHPVRHNIWTPIIHEIQASAFKKLKKRICDSRVYIRNAIEDASAKKSLKGKVWNNSYVDNEIEELGKLIANNNPKIVLTFGAFSYEFTRRALKQGPDFPFAHWNTKNLGVEFRNTVANFSFNGHNIFPLLHRSIAGGHFLKGHENFTNDKKSNYFEYVGKMLSEVIIKNHSSMNIWA